MSRWMSAACGRVCVTAAIAAWAGAGMHMPASGAGEADSFPSAQVAYSTGGALWVMEGDGSDPVKLADAPPGTEILLPAWSYDGLELAYVVLENAGVPRRSAIWLVHADGTGNRQLIASEPGTDVPDYPGYQYRYRLWTGPSFSPDGQRLAAMRIEVMADLDGVSPGGWHQAEVSLVTIPVAGGAPTVLDTTFGADWSWMLLADEPLTPEYVRRFVTSWTLQETIAYERPAGLHSQTSPEPSLAPEGSPFTYWVFHRHGNVPGSTGLQMELMVDGQPTPAEYMGPMFDGAWADAVHGEIYRAEVTLTDAINWHTTSSRIQQAGGECSGTSGSAYGGTVPFVLGAPSATASGWGATLEAYVTPRWVNLTGTDTPSTEFTFVFVARVTGTAVGAPWVVANGTTTVLDPPGACHALSGAGWFVDDGKLPSERPNASAVFSVQVKDGDGNLHTITTDPIPYGITGSTNRGALGAAPAAGAARAAKALSIDACYGSGEVAEVPCYSAAVYDVAAGRYEYVPGDLHAPAATLDASALAGAGGGVTGNVGYTYENDTVRTIQADGTGYSRLDTLDHTARVSWAPTGRGLAVTTYAGGAWQIAYLDLETEQASMWPVAGARDAAFSPLHQTIGRPELDGTAAAFEARTAPEALAAMAKSYDWDNYPDPSKPVALATELKGTVRVFDVSWHPPTWRTLSPSSDGVTPIWWHYSKIATGSNSSLILNFRKSSEYGGTRVKLGANSQIVLRAGRKLTQGQVAQLANQQVHDELKAAGDTLEAVIGTTGNILTYLGITQTVSGDVLAIGEKVVEYLTEKKLIGSAQAQWQLERLGKASAALEALGKVCGKLSILQKVANHLYTALRHSERIKDLFADYVNAVAEPLTDEYGLPITGYWRIRPAVQDYWKTHSAFDQRRSDPLMWVALTYWADEKRQQPYEWIYSWDRTSGQLNAWLYPGASQAPTTPVAGIPFVAWRDVIAGWTHADFRVVTQAVIDPLARQGVNIVWDVAETFLPGQVGIAMFVLFQGKSMDQILLGPQSEITYETPGRGDGRKLAPDAFAALDSIGIDAGGVRLVPDLEQPTRLIAGLAGTQGIVWSDGGNPGLIDTGAFAWTYGTHPFALPLAITDGVPAVAPFSPFIVDVLPNEEILAEPGALTVVVSFSGAMDEEATLEDATMTLTGGGQGTSLSLAGAAWDDDSSRLTVATGHALEAQRDYELVVRFPNGKDPAGLALDPLDMTVRFRTGGAVGPGGGDVSTTARSGVIIPAGALPASQWVGVAPADPDIDPPPGFRQGGLLIELLPAGTALAAPVTVVLPLADDLPVWATPTIMFYDGSQWRDLGGTIYWATGTVRAATSQFGVFGLFYSTEDLSPVAAFSLSPPNPAAGETLEFDATAAYDPDGTIETYAWSFGDGAEGAGMLATHAYASAGAYQVTLTVTDNDGNTNAITRPVTVETRAQQVQRSRFGAGGTETNEFAAIRDLGAHWRRLIWDVDRWLCAAPAPPFWPWDPILGTQQADEIWGYGIVTPRRAFNPPPGQAEWPTAADFAGLLKKTVERYDGDGYMDMPNLRYPIKVYEICSGIDTSETFMWGGFTDPTYRDYMAASYQALKEACPECRLAAGAVMGEMNAPGMIRTFDTLVDGGGAAFFDVVSYHSYFVAPEWPYDMMEQDIDSFLAHLRSKGVAGKAVWWTETLFGGWMMPIGTQEEVAAKLVRAYVHALANGVERVSPYALRAQAQNPEGGKWSCLIDEAGARRPSFDAYRTLIGQTDFFSRAEMLEPGRYRFTVNARPVYVLWGAGTLPDEIAGELEVTDLYGATSTTDAAALELGPAPVYVGLVPQEEPPAFVGIAFDRTIGARGAVVLAVETVPGTRYSLQYADADGLAQELQWQTAETFTAQATAHSCVDELADNPAAARCRFYRVLEEE